ncbi:Rieske (2Fe-2S) protein [Rhodopirellula sp. SWK7]|uniref:Rieske (2Fe-2S) protein n=1 Tax=Rhodopirellula sp. SWK7 TaxID=595460 RepID=UPI0002BE767F|nr:Rieske (2Fe-2S) protein [Rhodopirellula sp. SWK7]EMI45082.1 Rieske [2Fe-2S] iron-sulfur domain protein [Rhodopirellula sp. SWK7]
MSDSDRVPRFPNDVVSPANRTDGNEERAWQPVIEIRGNESCSGESTLKTVSRSQVESGEDFAVEALIDGRVVAIFRHAGEWYAMDGMCSHQGGPLAEGVVRDGCVTCPWHGWQYDLATGIQMINRQPLQESFPVRQLEDRVEISLT